MKDESYKLNPEIAELHRNIGEKFYVDSANSPFTLSAVDVLQEKIVLTDAHEADTALSFEEFKAWKRRTNPILQAGERLRERMIARHKSWTRKFQLPEEASLQQITSAARAETLKNLQRLDERHGTHLTDLYTNFYTHLTKIQKDEITDAVPESNEGKNGITDCNLFAKAMRDEIVKIKDDVLKRDFLESMYMQLLPYFVVQNNNNGTAYPETYEEWEKALN